TYCPLFSCYQYVKHKHYYIVFQGDFFMKKIYYLFIFTLVFSSYVNDKHTTHAEESIHVSANQAVLIEQATGRVLYEKDSHEPSSVASITKVMTALLAIEYGDL